MSQIWPLLPDLSSKCPRDHFTLTTTEHFTSPKHTVGTFEGWVNSCWWSEWEQTDRFIYREVGGKKRASEVLHVSKCLTKDMEQGRMIFIVPQSLSCECLLQPCPRQIYQSSFNVIYSHGVKRKWRRHKDGLSCRIEGFMVEWQRE